MRVHLRGIHAASLSILTLGSILTACFGGFGAGGEAWTGPPFSADMVDGRQPQKSPTHVYMGNGRIRVEGGDTTSHMVLVFDPGTQTTLLIDDARKTYIDAGMFTRVIAVGFAPILRFFRPMTGGDPCAEWNTTVDQFASFGAQFSGRRTSGPPPKFTCHDAGTDNVNGRSAEKWTVTEDTDHETGTVWIDSRLHVITKSVDKNGAMELRNVQEGAQPDAMFAPPAGYRKIGITEVLAGLRKATGAPSAPGDAPTR